MTEDNNTTPAEEHADEHLSDTVHLLGREFTVTGGIYTVVFIALAILTLIEVTVPSLAFLGQLQVPILLSIAVARALLVILFYMHLRTDNRIFAVALGVPLLVTLLSVTYLLAVPLTY